VRRLIAAILALAATVACTAEPRTAWHTLPGRTATPTRILVLGDSRSSNGVWQTDLGVLLAGNGVAVDIATAAVAGTRCGYWPDKIAGVLADTQPDLVVIACGTNDDPTEQVYGEPKTGWAIRYLIEAVHGYRPNNPARVVPALPQYSDPLIAFDWLLTNEPQTADTLWVNINRYSGSGWLAGVADFQRIPATADYLADERSAQYPIGLGIHPTTRGSEAMARIVYRAAAAQMGWPPIGEQCGLFGHRNRYPRPTYTPCG
jgi:lysophospholipase L1-like esterase